jgi:hypothetical protein
MALTLWTDTNLWFSSHYTTGARKVISVAATTQWSASNIYENTHTSSNVISHTVHTKPRSAHRVSILFRRVINVKSVFWRSQARLRFKYWWYCSLLLTEDTEACTIFTFSKHSQNRILFCVLRPLYSVYCLCVNVYCTTATGCQPNCS